MTYKELLANNDPDYFPPLENFSAFPTALPMPWLMHFLRQEVNCV